MTLGNKYEIVNFETGLETTLVMFITRPQSIYIIEYDDKKRIESALLLPIILSIIINKKVTCSYNES